MTYQEIVEVIKETCGELTLNTFARAIVEALDENQAHEVARLIEHYL